MGQLTIVWHVSPTGLPHNRQADEPVRCLTVRWLPRQEQPLRRRPQAAAWAGLVQELCTDARRGRCTTSRYRLRPESLARHRSSCHCSKSLSASLGRSDRCKNRMRLACPEPGAKPSEVVEGSPRPSIARATELHQELFTESAYRAMRLVRREGSAQKALRSKPAACSNESVDQ